MMTPARRPEALAPDIMEPLLGIDDLAAYLNCSRRLLERLRSAKAVPPPDLHVGRMPRWKAATIHAWINSGGKGVA